MKVVYGFEDYTPLEINVGSIEDLNNLNILINYCMSGAIVRHDSGPDEDKKYYYVDMSFENGYERDQHIRNIINLIYAMNYNKNNKKDDNDDES